MEQGLVAQQEKELTENNKTIGTKYEKGKRFRPDCINKLFKPTQKGVNTPRPN